MEDNKYYTPKIEEFHVGFECETYIHTSTIGNKEGYSNWYPIVFGKTNTKYESLVLGDILHTVNINVKYLDKEDIESFGFKHDPIRDYGDFRECYFKLLNDNEGYSLDYILKEHKIIIKQHKMDKPLIIIFRGIIKNKSELKVLLKQLEII